MIRISLIIAIIAGVAALTISQLKVADKINTLTSDLETTKQTLATSQEAERKAKKDAKDATAAADKAKKELETTKTDLAAASEKADQQEKQNGKIFGEHGFWCPRADSNCYGLLGH